MIQGQEGSSRRAGGDTKKRLSLFFGMIIDRVSARTFLWLPERRSHSSALGPVAKRNPWRNWSIEVAISLGGGCLLAYRPTFLRFSSQSFWFTVESNLGG